MTIISASIIPLVNIVAKAFTIINRDILILTTIKKARVTYTGLMVQTKFSAPIAILLTIASWKISLMVIRKSGYFAAHLGKVLLPGLPE